MVTEACAHRVQSDVMEELDEVLLAVDEPGAEATVEEVSVKTMAFVELPRIGAIQLVHPSGEAVHRGFQDQVEVVRKQAVRDRAPAPLPGRAASQPQEQPSVGVVVEDCLSSVSSSNDVVGAVRKLASR